MSPLSISRRAVLTVGAAWVLGCLVGAYILLNNDTWDPGFQGVGGLFLLGVLSFLAYVLLVALLAARQEVRLIAATMGDIEA